MTIPFFYTISDDFTPYLAVSVSSLAKMQGMVDMVGQILNDPQNWFHVKQEVKVTL